MVTKNERPLQLWGRRGIVTWAAPALLVLVILATLLVHAGVFGANKGAGAASDALIGTSMQGHPAAPFTLQDQNGATVSLSALRGKVIILTFLDATCTQQCPLMVQYLNQTTRFMTPQQVSQIAWVAITVNPHNTPAQASAFLAKNKATMGMRFLLGSQAQLQPLWKAYYIDVEPGLTDVTHTSGLYLVDQQGHERIWMDQGFDPKTLASDAQTLLRNGA